MSAGEGSGVAAGKKVEAKTPLSQRAGVVDDSESWADLKPVRVDMEDTLNAKKVAAVWAAIYDGANMSSASEAEKRAMRLACYKYGCLNGTSRVGGYQGMMTLNNGTEVEAALIPMAAGEGNIRRFFRGNMIESYKALRGSRTMEDEARFIAKCAEMGIGPSEAFATSDWMTDCPLFTPEEKKAHNVAFMKGIERARRARGGMSLEGVEREESRAIMRAQGPDVETGSEVKW